MTFAGTPAAMTLGGIVPVTTLPAPMIVLSPILDPFRTSEPMPTHTSFPMTTGWSPSSTETVLRLEGGHCWWKSESTMTTFAATMVPSPIWILRRQVMEVPFNATSSPMTISALGIVRNLQGE